MNSNHNFNYRHLTISQSWLKNNIYPGMKVLDATCGNGHDSLTIAQSLFAKSNEESLLYSFDIQEIAVIKTTEKLSVFKAEFSRKQIICEVQDHSRLDQKRLPELDIVVYNLGYLPGSDKSITTLKNNTITSLKQSMMLLKPGGAISLMCYPGHDEGLEEFSIICSYLKTKEPNQWNICMHEWINRQRAPVWILIEKSLAINKSH